MTSSTSSRDRLVEIPLVFTTSLYAFDKILLTGKILSKKQLREQGISFEQHTSSYVSLEHALGTYDDVTLFIDPLFRSDLYGGMLNVGPRIIFDRRLLYQEGVYMLPMDQGGYYDGLNDQPRKRFPYFEQDKMHTSDAKDRFIDEMNIQSIIEANDPLSFQGVPCPEVHVPGEVPLSLARAFLMHERYIEKFQERLEVAGKVIVPFHEREEGHMVPDSLSLLAAYKHTLKQQEI